MTSMMSLFATTNNTALLQDLKNLKPDCYECVHMERVPGNAHVRCNHSIVYGNENATVIGHFHGVQRGWFYWPFLFDPTWLVACDGFRSRTMTDQELLEKNAQIPSEEIEQDIRETETEIATMHQEAEHLERTPLSLPNAKLDHWRAQARRDGIKRREQFIDNLKKLLALRKATAIQGHSAPGAAPCTVFVRDGDTTSCKTCGFGKFEHQPTTEGA